MPTFKKKVPKVQAEHGHSRGIQKMPTNKQRAERMLRNAIYSVLQFQERGSNKKPLITYFK
jgi:hypothetical protein